MKTIQYKREIYYPILLLLIALPFSLHSQPATIRGKVTSLSSGESLPGVTILLDHEPKTSSDSLGLFELTADSGTHVLSFVLISFEEKTLTLSLRPAENRVIKVNLDDKTEKLKMVVISAGKFEQNIEDVTVSMEVIKPRLIENTNTTTMESALNKVPGVNVLDGQANIRGGSGWSYGAGSRVQVLVDDLPQLTADASDVKWNFIPLENLEQVEIIKGASSVLFGSSALNGVINIRTAYPKDKPVTKINLFSGMYDKSPTVELNDTSYPLSYWGNNPQFNAGIDFFHSHKYGSFDLVFGGNIFKDEGFRQGENEIRYRANANTRYRFKKTPGLSAGINFNSMISTGAVFFLWKNDTTGGYLPAENTISEKKTYRTNVDPFITYADNKGNIHRLRTRWFNTNNQNNTHQNSIGDLFYAEYQYQKHVHENLTLSGGLVEIYSKVKSELYSDHDGNQFAGYLQGDVRLNKVSLSGGLRAEQHRVDNLHDKVTFVFRSGATWHLAEQTYLRGSFGQGYRFPSIAELFIRTNIGSVIIYPNSSLTPEKGFSAETGIKQVVKIGTWKALLDLAAFINQYDDMMEFTFGQWGAFTEPLAGNGFRSLNVGDTRIKGMEFSMTGEGNIARGLTVTALAGYTYIDPRQIRYDSSYIAKVGVENFMGSDSTDFLKYRYSHLVRADVEFGYRKFAFGIGFRYNSRMVNIDNIFVNGTLDYGFPPGLGIEHYRVHHHHGDAVVDLRSSWQFNKIARVSLIVKNVLNNVYMDRPAIYEAPRTFVIQFGLVF